MRYEVVHTTEYEYSETVAVSHHVARLRPRSLANQECLQHELTIEPPAAVTSTYEDYFGNGVTFFAMQGAHKRLTIRARTTMALTAPSLPDPAQTVRSLGRPARHERKFDLVQEAAVQRGRG